MPAPEQAILPCNVGTKRLLAIEKDELYLVSDLRPTRKNTSQLDEKPRA